MRAGAWPRARLRAGGRARLRAGLWAKLRAGGRARLRAGLWAKLSKPEKWFRISACHKKSCQTLPELSLRAEQTHFRVTNVSASA